MKDDKIIKRAVGDASGTVSVLVTGGNGQLGTELNIAAGKHSSLQLTCIGRAQMDLGNNDSIRKYLSDKRFDFIINCAAYTAVDKAEEEPAIAHQVNGTAVRVLSEICRDQNTRLIHISTDYVFDGTFSTPIGEDALPNPLSVYGHSKLAGERHVLDCLHDAYVVRTSWVYSTFGKNFVKTIQALSTTRSEIGVIVDQIGTPTYAADLAQALLSMISDITEQRADQPGIYNYTSEGAISWYDFAHFIVASTQSKCRIVPIMSEEYKTLAVRPKYSVLNKSKFRQTFRRSIDHWSIGLADCMNQLKEKR